jgi:Zn finger protein HypA/HybF involved in hydrogenase expression
MITAIPGGRFIIGNPPSQPACTVCNDSGVVMMTEGEIACPMCRSGIPLYRPHLVTIACESCGVGIELCECEL